LADLDGLSTISYQWQANGTNISGATGATYTLTQAEVGKTIDVVASYTDLLGTAESKTSSNTAPVANINDLPTGTVNITGTPTQGQILTASNTLADLDGIPSSGANAITYQWQANGINISGATGATYTLTQAEVGKTMDVVASYVDNYGALESKTSSVSSIVSAPSSGSNLQGIVYQWKTHALLTDVLVDLVAPGINTPSNGTHLYELRNIQTVNGHLVVDLWANLTQGVNNFDIALELSNSINPTFTASSNLPSDWTEIANNTAGQLAISAFGLNNAITGSLLLGQIDLGVATTAATQIHLSGAAGVDTNLQTQNDYAIGIDKTDATGLYDFTALSAATYSLIASKSLTSAETGTAAISSADALAALKIAVGINPNSDPDGVGPLLTPTLSPYQLIAADANADGRVTSADALAILKMAVKYAGAPAREWLFVKESEDFWNETTQTSLINKNSVLWDSADKQVILSSDTNLNLVGVLKGDVNGSWTAPANSSFVAATHFDPLIAQGLGTKDQWVL
jgi:hypothetical protein